MQSPIAHICRHRARTDAQRASIARNRTHSHVHPTNMCLIQGICSHALLLRTLLRTFLRALLRCLPRRRRRSQLAAHAVLQAPHPAFVPHKRSTRAQTTCTVCALRCAAYALTARCVCRRFTGHRAPGRSALPLRSSPLLPGASRHRVCELTYAARRHAVHCCTPALRLNLAHRCDVASPRRTARRRSDPATGLARARNHARLAPSPAPPLASALCSPPLARYRTARVSPRVAVR